MLVRAVLGLSISIIFASCLTTNGLWVVPPDTANVDMPATFRANSGMDFPKSVNTVDPSKFKSRKLILPSGAEGDLMAAGSEENGAN